MDEHHRHNLAERLAAMLLMLPAPTREAVAKHLSAVERADDPDERVYELARVLLADSSVEWADIEYTLTAMTTDDVARGDLEDP